ncbi:MAG: serine hydrolase [Pseudomonadota bacterium]
MCADAWAGTDAYPTAASAYVLAFDDQVLWSRAADTQRPPASLAKLLSALVLLREPWDNSETITVSKAAADIEGTQLGLHAGEQLRASDALTAMLLRSANDVCLALAEHAAGSADAFVTRMNALARDLGMLNSSFRTPCGLDAVGQHTSASDLLILARAAMRSPEIASRVALERASVTTIAGRHITFTNNNALVGRLRGTIGLKSGFTNAAGKCVIAVVERDGHRIWLVMLDAPNRWWVADGMIEAAFSRPQREGR